MHRLKTCPLSTMHQHRVNASERVVQTFKNHFIAGLSTVDQNFPLQLWDILIPQAQDTLNLFRRCWSNSKLSAYASLEGEFNFDKTPLANIGTRALLYLGPKQRDTWQTHAIDAWYTGPAMNHYRCYTLWIPEHKSQRIRRSAKFFLHTHKIPQISREARILVSARELTDALMSKGNTLQVPEPTRKALRDLSNIFMDVQPEKNMEPPRVKVPSVPTTDDPITKSKI